ncbi:hypothetical protein HYFRA_00008407 [Hymenoscyphus fraxineus]|uniref:Uncharacterized protein n=1 Tax=Hymenoscyphus fraxineus TaxID=746836 RepID=A0A9N9KLZ9_9HELO|nr:hypothetical protein HYFRA_00008407 [Hymenoscyphus fraxineus]
MKLAILLTFTLASLAIAEPRKFHPMRRASDECKKKCDESCPKRKTHRERFMNPDPNIQLRDGSKRTVVQN